MGRQKCQEAKEWEANVPGGKGVGRQKSWEAKGSGGKSDGTQKCREAKLSEGKLVGEKYGEAIVCGCIVCRGKCWVAKEWEEKMPGGNSVWRQKSWD